ncbi:SPFH domain-containing protein [Flavicella sp.]|uniref:SPFH domain-containing protein n=1 Tax=Flavicella sp. TaxID=2957742 RepID=UPI00261E748C|nr:SPFH domain-containing protein [Flavicella sp.]MDG1805759.1 SPFH domain-containing protein [Flavicella sp.]MDG2280525.1 SPFH domain-containing protein [Flavicella sp.]
MNLSNFGITPTRVKVLIGVGVLAVAIISFNPFSNNDAGERQVVQTLSGDLDVRFTPGLYFSGFFSKVTTYPNNVTIQVSSREHISPDADYHMLPHMGTFSEGDAATLSHTTKWDLPSDKSKMIDLHKTYTNINNLMTTTLLMYQKQIASYSTQRMSSEAHYSGGQSQLNEYFQDQLRNGQVLLITETKTRLLEDGSTKTYIQVQEKLDEKGNIKRSVSDIQEYGIVASFASIDEVIYDDRIYEKLKAKIDAASDEATAKQELITAQQEALTEKAKGEKLIAKTKATEEADELQEVIRARKAKLVAAENLEQAKLDAAAKLVLKEAEAKGDKLKVAAGLTPLEAASIEMETRIGVARELAKANVPNIVIGGGDGGANPMEAVGIKYLMDINDKLSKRK